MYTGGVHDRRKRTIERLEAQLKSGEKTSSPTPGYNTKVPLTDKDTTRIKKELTILKSRV